MMPNADYAGTGTAPVMCSTFRIVDGVPWVADRPYPWAKKVETSDNPRFPVRHFWLQFETGAELSVTWGSCSYSANHDSSLGGEWVPESPNAEIAMWDKDGNWFEWPDGDTVCGYVTPEFVNAIVDLLARQGPEAVSKQVVRALTAGTHNEPEAIA